MADKILIASGKGGVGKSTVASFLARAYASDGKKVLAIDSDTGLGALDVMLGVADKKMNTWIDVINGECELKNAIIKVSDTLHLLPSPSVFPDKINDDAFKIISEKAENDYDVILVDAAAGIDESLKRTAKICEKAVFIATADAISVNCASSAALKAQEYGIDRENMRLIINRFEKKAAMKSKLLNIDGVIDKSGVMLLGILPEDKEIPFSSVTGKIPDKKTTFAKAVKRIYDRMNGKSVPLNLKKM